LARQFQPTFQARRFKGVTGRAFFEGRNNFVTDLAGRNNESGNTGEVVLTFQPIDHIEAIFTNQAQIDQEQFGQLIHGRFVERGFQFGTSLKPANKVSVRDFSERQIHQ